MKLRRLALVAISFTVAVAAQGCAADDDEEPVDASEAAQSKALPITGEWALAQWQGHVELQQGSWTERQRLDSRFDASARVAAVTFDLDANGDGTIRASGRCAPSLGGEPGAAKPGSGQAVVAALAAAAAGRGAAAGNVFNVVSALWGLYEMLTCDPTKPVVKTMPVYQSRNFIGQPSRKLWANVGVYGENKGIHAADNECRALRGVRWLSLGQGAVACIGYADGAARTLKMMVQRPGDIYVQRLVLRRPSDP